LPLAHGFRIAASMAAASSASPASGQRCRRSRRRVRDVFPSELRRRTADRLEHRGLARVQVAGQPYQAALERCAEVGDDVSGVLVAILELAGVEHHIASASM
jgi:hypothetical protein